ncbi:MAG: hypothetical protein QOF20_26 [Acidimicrobiaceae bacterium]|jgi:hypothetical protein|nr:hypothetical protein [Acidimicrobiaceae bacterium]
MVPCEQLDPSAGPEGARRHSGISWFAIPRPVDGMGPSRRPLDLSPLSSTADVGQPCANQCADLIGPGKRRRSLDARSDVSRETNLGSKRLRRSWFDPGPDDQQPVMVVIHTWSPVRELIVMPIQQGFFDAVGQLDGMSSIL